jgi:monoamine oxidase
MSSYDIVVMGAGHNGLTAAAYMAKAGKKVLVLESKPHFGGGVSTRELITPGYWHDEHSNVHIMIQGNPMLREDELGRFRGSALNISIPISSMSASGKMAPSSAATRIWTGLARNWLRSHPRRTQKPIANSSA